MTEILTFDSLSEFLTDVRSRNLRIPLVVVDRLVWMVTESIQDYMHALFVCDELSSTVDVAYIIMQRQVLLYLGLFAEMHPDDYYVSREGFTFVFRSRLYGFKFYPRKRGSECEKNN